MSAIAGIYFLDRRSVDHADVEQMAAHIAHRGPDRAGLWCKGPVGLAHRMLWTTPESKFEHSPLVSHGGAFVLTADSRIDNRDELFRALGIRGRSVDELTDGDLILAAYEKWRERCPEHLLGDFAFAVWDAARELLFCARDHFGVKPFYYHYRPDRAFVFASQIKALLGLPDVPCRLNETRVADYLASMLDDKTDTFYQGILRLPPAHSLSIGRESLALRTYWNLDLAREIRLGSNEQYADAFREIFTEAVRCRLRSAGPVGSMLSGGLDSSSIACTARDLLAQNRTNPLHTFSAIFEDVPQSDERPFIHAAIESGGLNAHFVHGDRLSPLADFDTVLSYEDEAFYSPNLFLHWGLYREAQQHGVRVLLDGFDGDIAVSHGIGHLCDLARTGRWVALGRDIRGLAQHFHRSPWRILVNHVIRPMAPVFVWHAWRSFRDRTAPQKASADILNAEFAERMRLRERRQEQSRSTHYGLRSARRFHYSGLTHGLIPFTLEVADRAAAAFAIEPRYPFFDKRVAEFCLAISGEQKLSNGWTRMVLRRAMAHILPESIRWRGGKGDLSHNFVRRLLEPNRALLEYVLLKEPKVVERYIDASALNTVYQRYLREHTAEDALTVWKVASLALWLRSTGITP